MLLGEGTKRFPMSASWNSKSIFIRMSVIIFYSTKTSSVFVSGSQIILQKLVKPEIVGLSPTKIYSRWIFASHQGRENHLNFLLPQPGSDTCHFCSHLILQN